MLNLLLADRRADFAIIGVAFIISKIIVPAFIVVTQYEMLAFPLPKGVSAGLLVTG